MHLSLLGVHTSIIISASRAGRGLSGSVRQLRFALWPQGEADEIRAQSGGRCERKRSGSNSVVECDLAKVEVAGSNPVSRSKSSSSPRGSRTFPNFQAVFWRFDSAGGLFSCMSLVYSLGRGTQVVRERSAKPLYVSSILTRASSLFQPMQLLPQLGPPPGVAEFG
jgi:hypothetical protein